MLTLGLLLRLSQFSPNSGMSVPEEPYFPKFRHLRTLFVFPSATANCKSHQFLLHAPDSENPLHCDTCGYRKVCVCGGGLDVGLSVFNCSVTADLSRAPKSLMGTGLLWGDKPIPSPIPAACPQAWALCTGCDPRIPHCPLGCSLATHLPSRQLQCLLSPLFSSPVWLRPG